MASTTTQYSTVFGSLDQYDKGGVEAIADDPRNYVFSNMFEVAANAAPWEKVAVAKNMEYVLEVIRAEGTSPWRATPHDEFALVVDGRVVIELIDPDEPLVDAGCRRLDRRRRRARRHRDGPHRGVPRPHGTAPAGRCYRFVADEPSVILLQTIEGPDTVYRWAEICQTS